MKIEFMKIGNKIFIFTTYSALTSLDRPVINEFVKKLESLSGSCVSKRSVKLSDYRLFRRGFLFLWQKIYNTTSTVISYAVVWIVQRMAILNHTQKQSGKHSGVSNISTGSKAQHLTSDQQGASKTHDTDCQQNTVKCLRDVEENGCLVSMLKGLIIKAWLIPNPLLGYRGNYAQNLIA